MRTITLTELRKALHGQHCESEHNEHRIRSVQGQTITQEKECFGTDHYTGEGMHRGRQFLRDECTGPNHYTGERM